jgi:hypothetical protein
MRLITLLSLPLLISSSSLTLRWEDEIGTAGSVCSTSTSVCQAFSHVVFVATPSDATNLLTGYAQVSMDGGDYEDSTDIVFEAHLVTGVCAGSGQCTDYGPSQMFNWGYEAEFKTTDTLPSKICIAPQVTDTVTNETTALPAKCLTFSDPAYVSSQGSAVTSSINDFSSAVTRYCSPDSPATCRSNIHVVFTATNPMPTAIMETGGEYSYDGGRSWSSLNAKSFYEQHIDASSSGASSKQGGGGGGGGGGSSYAQAFQFDYDSIDSDGSSASDAAEASEACVRVWVYDDASQQNHTVVDGDCYAICETLTYFHDPAGYCA